MTAKCSRFENGSDQACWVMGWLDSEIHSLPVCWDILPISGFLACMWLLSFVSDALPANVLMALKSCVVYRTRAFGARIPTSPTGRILSSDLELLSNRARCGPLVPPLVPDTIPSSTLRCDQKHTPCFESDLICFAPGPRRHQHFKFSAAVMPSTQTPDQHER